MKITQLRMAYIPPVTEETAVLIEKCFAASQKDYGASLEAYDVDDLFE